ncbi:hypothetical protein BDV23DRAFT_175752 [Aspergillus alliaceus]|uniref:Major facilitator superfamily domain-containing protein n=1 Tax=Petromyces alliaceus TaxID=209559 RepID=A0A5N7BW70_PETAA|nr:hypothetical protein BDV23DRAFT_175752 [Aspergillus alliaceus]
MEPSYGWRHSRRSEDAGCSRPTERHIQMTRRINAPPRGRYSPETSIYSAPRSLLPYISDSYDMSYASVSLIFVANGLGHLVATPQAYFVVQKVGRIGAFLILACHRGFPVTVVAFWFVGIGEALNLTLNNVYWLLHDSYGAGGTLRSISGYVHGVPWTQFYCVTLACTVVNGITSSALFREHKISTNNQSSADFQASPSLIAQAYYKLSSQTAPRFSGKFYLRLSGSRSVHVRLDDRILITYRAGDPAAVGYITKRSVLYFIMGCILLQVLVWCAWTIIGNGVAMAGIGLLLGPVYPCAVSSSVASFPMSCTLRASYGISAMGSSGRAVVPLKVGFVAQRFGTVILHPLYEIMYGIMLTSWVMLPNSTEADEN